MTDQPHHFHVPTWYVELLDDDKRTPVLVPESTLALMAGERISVTLPKASSAGRRFEMDRAEGNPAWITLKQAALLHQKDRDGLTFYAARNRVRRAIDADRLDTNGKHGRELRIEVGRFSEWRIEQRDENLGRDWSAGKA